MKRYTVYERKTMRLIREGQCSDVAFEAQAMNDGEAVIESSRCLKRTYVEILPTPDPSK